ncbi:MAG: type II secretion system protein, partial [Nitrospirae bacterium]|nr:type II secretion system protein [Nitrospirota bacterium]
MKRRKGFTLIELIVAMAILLILIYMSFAAFTYITAFSRSSTQRENVQENLSMVLDQVTKELRQTFTADDGSGNFGVEFPAYSSSSNTTRDIKDISDPDPPLTPGQYYSYGKNDPDETNDFDHPILTFYEIDNTDPGTKHRISYTLSVPNDGSGYSPPNYTGIARNYWVSQEYEPCQLLYSNETSIDGGITWPNGVHNQPVTDQVVTNFSVIRPSWSSKVIQIVIE